MNCSSCGAVCPDGAKFCFRCGAQLTPAPVVESINNEDTSDRSLDPPPSLFAKILKKLPVKLPIAIAAVVLLVVLIVALSSGIFSASEYYKPKSVITTGLYDDELTLYPSSGKPVTLDMDTDSDYTLLYSFDGDRAALWCEEDNALYYFNGTSLESVADNVLTFAISADGRTVVYIDDTDNYSGDLYLYRNKETTTLAYDVAAWLPLCVSPDGRTVGYSIGDDDEEHGYIWDGKSTELGENKLPFCVSDGSKYIYYIRNSDSYDSTAYVQTGMNDDSREKIGECDYYSHFIFNRDCSELLFCGEDEKTYISANGNARIKASSDSCYPVLPYGSFSRSMTAGSTRSFGYIYMYCIDSFAGKTLRTSDKVIYLDRDFESRTVVSSCDTYYLADDGLTLYYLKRDSVYKVNVAKENAQAQELVEDEVIDMVITSDGKTVYFVNEDEELYSQTGKKSPELVCDELSENYFDGYYSLSQGYLFEGKTLYYFIDNELYSTTGGKGKRVETFDDEIARIYCTDFYVRVYVDSGVDTQVYYATDGKSFTLLYEY